jgi:hypothetical protein
MSSREIEKRLIALEQEIAHLKAEKAPAAHSHPVQTLERLHNRFENDEAFREATRLGRKWRESQRPAASKSKAKRR